MNDETIIIDGCHGEGGGQILRTSLALSAISGRPFVIDRIRGRRRKPGLLRQHLTAVRAAAQICRASVRGDALGSSHLEFCPGPIDAGDYEFAVGSAGSATLVFQTVLWPLLTSPGSSRVVFSGGTHNPLAPPFEFIDRAYLPLLRSLGVVAEATLEQAGFNPAGGGRFVVSLEGGRALAGLQLETRGAIQRCEALALIANLSRRIASRELATARAALVWSREQCQVVELEGRGPGNALCLIVTCEHVTEVVTGFGDKGRSAEAVGAEAAAELRRWLDAEVPVGEHLADQLLIPMALAAAGFAGHEGGHASSFVTGEASMHTRTNAEIIARFLPVVFELEAAGAGRTRVRCRRR